MAGAKVIFFQQDVQGTTWIVAGLTDANGIASMRTNGTLVGAPAGKFKITVAKIEEPEFVQITRENYGNPRDLTRYDLIDPKFGSEKSTPLTFEVAAQKNTHEIHVGDPVRIEQRIIAPQTRGH